MRSHNQVRSQKSIIVLSILLTCSRLACGEERKEREETEEGTNISIQARSPDGKFAFRYRGDSNRGFRIRKAKLRFNRHRIWEAAAECR